MLSKFNIVVLVMLMVVCSNSYASYYDGNIIDPEDKNTCQGSPEDLVGKWVMDGDPNTYLELKSDGTVIEKSLGDPLERFWELKDGKLCLKAKSEENASELCWDYILNGNVLVITMNKMELYYVRSKKIN